MRKDHSHVPNSAFVNKLVCGSVREDFPSVLNSLGRGVWGLAPASLSFAWFEIEQVNGIVIAFDCKTQRSAMNVSAQTTMKDAAKCDKHFELQNSVKQ